MYWISDNFEEPEWFFILLALGVAVGMIYWGRRRLRWVLPLTLLFLLFSAAVIPCLPSAGPAAQRNACIAYLKQIQSAKKAWGETYPAFSDATPSEQDLVGEFLKAPPACPRGGVYSYGRLDERPTCTFAHKGHRLETP